MDAPLRRRSPRSSVDPIVIEGAPYTIVGVMPAGFGFPDRGAQLWTPFETPPSGSGAFWGSGGYRTWSRARARHFA